jgi:hypothetical protein
MMLHGNIPRAQAAAAHLQQTALCYPAALTWIIQNQNKEKHTRMCSKSLCITLQAQPNQAAEELETKLRAHTRAQSTKTQVSRSNPVLMYQAAAAHGTAHSLVQRYNSVA